MNFIQLIQTVLGKKKTPRTKRTVTPLHQTTRHSIDPQTEPAAVNVTETTTLPDQTPQESPKAVTGLVSPHPTESRVQVRYLDQSGQPLHKAVTLTGPQNTPLEIPWLKFSGFFLAQVNNLQRLFPTDQTTVTLVYQPQMAAPVVVYHRDLAGNLLVKPQLLRGQLNALYQATPLTGGLNFVAGVPENQSGRFQPYSQIVHYQYDPLDLSYDYKPSKPFIQLLAPSLAYPQPTTKYPGTTKLPQNSIWQLFGTATTTDNETWYFLGGQLWFKSNDVRLRNTNPYQKKAYHVPPHYEVNYQIIGSSEVDFQGVICTDQVTLWQAPYTKPLSKKFAMNTQVVIQKIVTLDNHSIWYQLADSRWVLSTGIKQLTTFA